MEYKEVDLGIEIDGKKLIFADRNVGAENVFDIGNWFYWGETEPILIGDERKKKWCCDNNDYAYTKYNNKDKKRILNLKDDAAHVNMGGDWRMPREEELELLLKNPNIKVSWTGNYKQSKVWGMLFKGNGQELFIPPAGFISDGWLHWCGTSGYIWSSDLSKLVSYEGYTYAVQLDIESPFLLKKHLYDYKITTNCRNFGCSVRGVKLI